jgi:hypothetical protein
MLLFPNGLDIFTHTEKFCFGTFVTPGHRDEALVIIRHFHRHPVTFLTEDDLDGEEIDEQMHRLSAKRHGDAPHAADAAAQSGPLRVKMRAAPILHKMGNDSLRFAQLQFGEAMFSVLDGGDSEEQPMAISAKERSEWKYSEIEEVRVRSRPMHLDVRFGGKASRFRLCSTEIQSIVIELYHRTPNLRVVFEPGPMKPFLYQLPRTVIVPRLVSLRTDMLNTFRDSSKALVPVYDVE